MSNTYTRSWAQSVADRGYKTFRFAELPDDLRVLKMHRKAIAQGFVRRIGFHDKGHNRTTSIWKVIL